MKSSQRTRSPLGAFHPLVAGWFRERLGDPTEIQTLAWPRIAAGEHVLVTAPTGSGKTLTAFLWALDRLLTRAWTGGTVRVLYVSPLRALNNDIRRNLERPLAELQERFRAAGEAAGAVRALTRSGDTPQEDRRRMARRPPEILITTPESLNILLTSKSGRAMLGGLACVVLDEIHAVAATKRGTHLITAVERLVPLSGEFQRIALSATVRPLSRVAEFVGGYRIEATAEGAEPRYRPRPVARVESRGGKAYDLRVLAPVAEEKPEEGLPALAAERTDSVWEPLVRELRCRIRGNRSTLLFANSRRVTEKVTRLLNEGEEAELAYSHHGSLSREIRAVVEERLKQGRLASIVATNSLELGIDIGSLDEVVLLRTPPTIASAVQRIGRAGHGVGEVSRGRLYPLFERDFLDAAVVARGVLEQDIEQLSPVEAPLDVLAQVVLSMVAFESRHLDEIYDALRASWPYRDLPRRQFDLVIEMLAGRYADSRVRELRPRIAIDRVGGRVSARPGAARLIYLSGGTIPDRGYYHLRLKEGSAKIGELDEEFVWERSIGDTFSLGAQSWRIVGITHNDVLVVPARRSAAMAPFWRAEERDRSFHLSRRIAELLETAETLLAGKQGARRLRRHLVERHALEEAAAAELTALLERQRAAAGGELPHRRHLLVERVADAGDERPRVIFHTFWGGKVNRPLALALAAAWDEEHREPLEVEHDNDCLMAALPDGTRPERLFELVRPDNIERLLRSRLERTGFFGARFRESAGRALLLPRGGFRRRVPLWLNRQRAKKLLEAVSGYGDFPVVVETWRTCLRDEFDLGSLKAALDELEQGAVRLTEVRTSTPSPFAANLVWKQTNRLMYEDDVPEGGRPGLRGDLLRELVYSSQLRPRLPGELIDRFQRKLHRTFPGYAPADGAELLEWCKERIAIPIAEWHELLAAVERDAEEGPEAVGRLLREIRDRALRVALPAPSDGGSEGRPDAGPGVVCAVESLPRLLTALGVRRERVFLEAVDAEGAAPPPGALAALEIVAAALPGTEGEEIGDEDGDALGELAAEWLRFYGPVPRDVVARSLGLGEETMREILETLTGDGRVVVDRFRETGEDLELCDAENLERLLRLLRAAARPSFEPRPLERLPLLLAARQGLAAPGGEQARLGAALEGLFGFPAPAGLWEGDLLPARLDPYYSAWLDTLLQESDLVWFGCGRGKLSFAPAGDLELFPPSGPDGGGSTAAGCAEPGGEPASVEAGEVFPDLPGRFSLEELARHSGADSGELTRRLWRLVWEGKVSNTAFLTVRRGVTSRFRPAEVARAGAGPAAGGRGAPRRSRRSRFARWRASRPWAGDWFRLDGEAPAEEPDALEREELNKDRVRQLLLRYGVLFRELLLRELPALQWASIFRTLRLMELSGEVLAGRFFDGIPGLQFASPAALAELRRGLPEDAVFWLNAADPASPCGLGLEGLRKGLPPRVPSNHLVYHGPRLVVVSRRNGAELEIRVGADHPLLEDYLGFLKVLLTRQFNPLKAVDVETVNGEPVLASPFGGRLAEVFSATREARSLRLRRRY